MFESALATCCRALASLKLTIPGIVVLGVGAWLTALGLPGGTLILTLASLLLALNLATALFVVPKFRRNPPLFTFHLCLLLLLLNIALGTQMRLRGHFEIAEGQMFSNADFIVDSRGKLSSAALPEGVFRQGPIEVDYAPGMERQQTRSSVWTMQGAVPEHHVVADGRPLVVEGYRIYPTHNKGFSAILSWRPQAGGAPVVGAVNFPSYPRLSWRQQSSWIIPDGQTLTLELMPAQIPLERNWILSADQAGALIHIETADGARWQLREGETVTVPGGQLRLEGLRMWMGYRVFYEPTLPWLFVTAFLTVAALAWWLWQHLGAPRAMAAVSLTERERPA